MTSLVEPIRGKVARVLNNRQVALNKGSVDGIQIGMVFKILSPKGSEITDPDTGEIIGSVELEKTSVKVTSVQDRVSVASTFRTHKVNAGGSELKPVTSLFEPPKWETRVETLKTDENANEELPEEESYIRTGDPVVQDLSPSD
jgi:hypothetical protein